MTDTPRTDARIKSHAGSCGLGELVEHYNDLLDFARTLEREPAAEINNKKQFERDWLEACDRIAQLDGQLETAWKLFVERGQRIEQLEAELAEARLLYSIMPFLREGRKP